ncbi:MAG TPA: hypothetical protein VHL13_04910, partial [Pseudolabrys sp.]|nr:hypothetical protein [Pseudolabrys sp.]
ERKDAGIETRPLESSRDVTFDTKRSTTSTPRKPEHDRESDACSIPAGRRANPIRQLAVRARDPQ